jgi:uncharacterized protein (DUF58 family)
MGLRQNALMLLLMTALLAIGGEWSGDTQLLHFWYVPAMLLLAGLAYEGWMAARAAPALRLQAPTDWFLGHATPVRLQLTHRLRRSLLFELAPNAPPEVALDRALRTLAVAPDAQGIELLSATARHLGVYRWPSINARSGGVLGLAWWPRSLPIEGEFRVVPDIVRDLSDTRGAKSGGSQIGQRFGGGAEILQLRDYRSGDAPRSIDWKASARSRRLISRDFSEDQQLDIVVAIDAGRSSALAAGDTDRLALYANVAARLAQRAVLLEDRIGLLTYAERPLVAMPPGHGAAAVTRARSLLAQMSSRPVESNPALAAVRLRSLVRHRSLVVMLTDLDDPSSASELRSALRLLLPTHLPFVAGVASERVEALARRRAANEEEVFGSLAAQEYANALRRNVASLQALGVPAVLASPQELDRAVLEAYLKFRQRRRI